MSTYDQTNQRQLQEVAVAMKRLELLKRQEAFDPIHLDSRPTAIQQEVINDFGKIKQQWIRAGNQCKPAYSLILMADGTRKPISEVQPGDLVMAFDYSTGTGVPSRVIQRWDNGTKEVFRYWFKKHEYTDATSNHLMPYHNGTRFNKRPIGESRELIIAPCVTTGGAVDVPHNGIELLGYLLGDGCLTKIGTYGLQITAKRPEIVEHVRGLLAPGYYLRDCGNGDYFISSKSGLKGKNIYINWIRDLGLAGKYAHEKSIPSVVFKSTVEERRRFISGLIATDGYITSREIGLCSTSEQLVRDYLSLLRTVGLTGVLSVGKRNNPNHRDLWAVEIKNGKYINKFHTEIVVPSKPAIVKAKYRGTTNHMWSTAKVRKVESLGEMPVYDITIEHPDHVYICDGLATSNSGKSATCARIVSWVLTNTHPSWKRPDSWGEEPLLIIVAGRTGKQIEDSLLPKIRGYLEPGTYKEVRIGNIIQRLELTNGNRVVFQSLENPTTARERLQSYVAHVVWVDELPPTIDIVRELLIRVQARDGYFLASFTPTVINIEIQRYVDGLTEPAAKVYRFHMLDNPLYADPTRREELVARYSHMPAHVQDAIFRGEWLSSDDMVYYFNWDTMVEMPPDYDPLRWRHIESVDPATQSALGLTIWAEHPTTGIWYCVLAQYLKGIYVPTEIIRAVQDITGKYNIVRRVADPNATWYIKQAGAMGISYGGVYSKNNRKAELIKQLQEKLGGSVRISPTCPDLISELQECRWSDRSDGKIINASSYHLLDSAQYACDNLPPKRADQIMAPSRDAWLRQQDRARREEIEKKRTAAVRKAELKHERRVRRAWAKRGRTVGWM